MIGDESELLSSKPLARPFYLNKRRSKVCDNHGGDAVEMLEFNWRDVSDVPGVDNIARLDLELRQALINLGFESIGFKQSRIPGASEDEAVKTANDLFIDPGPTVVTLFTERDVIKEILVSPDSRALATVVDSMGGPIVIFHSISEKGWVVTTRSDDPHPPRFRRTFTGLYVKITNRKGIGTWPKLGYFEQIEAMGVSDLWELHKNRVKSILVSSNQVIPSHSSIEISAACSYVPHRIHVFDLESSTRFNCYMVWASRIITLIPIVGSSLWCVATYAFPKYDLSRLFPAVLVLAVTLWLVALVALFVVKRVYTYYIQPVLNGPKPMTLDEILEEINRLKDSSTENPRAG